MGVASEVQGEGLKRAMIDYRSNASGVSLVVGREVGREDIAGAEIAGAPAARQGA